MSIIKGVKNYLNYSVSDTQITRAQRLWLYAVTALVMFFLVAPTLLVIPMSFSNSQYLEFPPRDWGALWYERYFESRAWRQATYTSLLAGLWTMALATPLGLAAAYGLHAAGTRWARAAFVVLILPMMIPVILAAVAIFYVYVKINIVNTLTGIVLAHTTLALPLVIIVLAAGLQNFDMNQERVARSLGATRWRAFCAVTLPQIRFSVISAALLAFLTSFDEVIMALFISGSDNSTLTRAMFLSLRDQIDPTIASVSTLMIVLTSAMLLCAQLFGRKKDNDD